MEHQSKFHCIYITSCRKYSVSGPQAALLFMSQAYHAVFQAYFLYESVV